MRGERWLLRVGEFLVGLAARRLPPAASAERYQEWAAELPVILGDPEIKPAAARTARMLWFAADTLRGAALGPAPARHRGAHRGPASMGKDARWLGVGAAPLAALVALLAIQALIVYYAIVISIGSVAGNASNLLSFSLAIVVGYLLRRRRGGTGRYWFAAGALATVAGGGAAYLAGHLDWGHPVLCTVISNCGYGVGTACISVAVVVVYRSRRGRRAGMQERSDREQLRGPAKALRSRVRASAMSQHAGALVRIGGSHMSPGGRRWDYPPRRARSASRASTRSVTGCAARAAAFTPAVPACLTISVTRRYTSARASIWSSSGSPERYPRTS